MCLLCVCVRAWHFFSVHFILSLFCSVVRLSVRLLTWLAPKFFILSRFSHSRLNHSENIGFYYIVNVTVINFARIQTDHPKLIAAD